MAGFSAFGRLALGVAIGAAGGALFAWAHLPLPWMIGAMVAVAAARLSGLPVEASRIGRNGGFIVVAIALGLYFTPEAAGVLLANLPWLVGAALATLAIGAALTPLLARMGRVDTATAWFASVPGGAADMAMLAEHYGGRPAPVAMAQMLRVVCIVVLVPNLMALAGLKGDFPKLATAIPFWWPGFAMLFALGLLAALILTRAGLKAGWMLGPLATTAVLTASGVTLSGVPIWLTSGAQVLMGAILGASFNREVLRRTRRFIPASLGHIALLLSGCAVVGVLLAWISGNEMGAMLLGTAPGGVPEMSLTAKLMGLDVALVVTMHVTRIFLVALLTPPVFRLVHRRPGGAGSPLPAPGE